MKDGLVFKGIFLAIIILLIGTSIKATMGISADNFSIIYKNQNYSESFIFVGNERFGLTPIADFSFTPEDPIIYKNIKFEDKSTDPQGTIVSWWWDFDDGYYSDLQNPVHCFYTNGTYNVSLKVTNDSGFYDSVQKEVVVFEDDIPPYVEIIAPEPRFIEFTLFSFIIKISKLYQIYFGKVYVIVNAWDNVGVESVKFYVDDIYRDIDYEPPYIWLWNDQAMLLPYILKVVARDYAGNEAVDMMKVWRHQIYPP